MGGWKPNPQSIELLTKYNEKLTNWKTHTHSHSSAHMANKQKDKCDAPLHAAPEPINRYGTPGAPPEKGVSAWQLWLV